MQFPRLEVLRTPNKFAYEDYEERERPRFLSSISSDVLNLDEQQLLELARQCPSLQIVEEIDELDCYRERTLCGWDILRLESSVSASRYLNFV